MPGFIHAFLQQIANLPGAPNTPVAQPVTNLLPLTKEIMQQWANDEHLTDSPVVDVYLQMIQNYINLQAGLVGPGAPANGPLDIYVQTSNIYTDLLETSAGHIIASLKLRDELGMTPAQFLQLRHFFMVIHHQIHWSLIVVSPQARRVEYIDSFRFQYGNWAHRVENVFVKVFEFLEYFLGPQFVANQWRTMTDQCPQQPDNSSCGTYVCNAAMAIACREPLSTRSYNSHNRWRDRCRIGAEIMNGGFTGIHNTHPIHPPPGQPNRFRNRQWRRLNQQLLTPQRRQRPVRSKSWLRRWCINQNRSRPAQWMRGHSHWGGAGVPPQQYQAAIERRLDEIFRGIYMPT